MYELVIVWTSGDTDIYEYATESEAREAGFGMKKAFGNQIEWYGTRRKISK
jgi:hypothetical protein